MNGRGFAASRNKAKAPDAAPDQTAALDAQLNRLARMEESSDVYQEMMAQATARVLAGPPPKVASATAAAKARRQQQRENEKRIEAEDDPGA